MSHPGTYSRGSSASEQDRLRRHADVLSDHANRLLDQVGLLPGHHAVDMGCGPRGVLDLLARRVGRAGRVVGVDQSRAMVAQARAFVIENMHDNIEVMVGDATEPQLPAESFDLVHARLLIINLSPPSASRAISQMMTLLRPGGVIALQDIDAGTFSCDPPHPSWDKLLSTFMGVSGDGLTGRRLPRYLREAGAVDIHENAYAMFCPPGHLWRHMLLQFSDMTRHRAQELGLATAEELDLAKKSLKAHLDDPRTSVLSPVVAQVWGRKAAHAVT
ncbi:MAG: methyltransferase domain-containing protein [Byssovorax sp.]